MKQSLSLLTIVVTLMACGPKIPEAKMNEINQLENSLDSSMQKIQAVDSADAFSSIAEFQENIAFFQAEVKDTLPMKTALVIDRYFRMRKSIGNYQNNYSNLKKEVLIGKEQLENLRFDAENGLLEEKYFDDYIALERENVKSVTAATNNMMEEFEDVLTVLKKQNILIDSLIYTYKIDLEKNE